MHKLIERDKKIIYDLTEKLIGTCQQGKFKKESLVTNVAVRIQETKKKTLAAYLDYANKNAKEFAKLISALTIHTTSWFREKSHFIQLEKYIRDNIKKYQGLELLAKCSPSSTGEEVYSLALVLESIKEDYPEFEYKIKGEDIDPISIQKASKGVFDKKNITQIPLQYHHFLLKGTNRINHLFTIKKEIRQKCFFSTGNLREKVLVDKKKYDLIFCRNCIIYFSPKDVDKIVENLIFELKKEGNLCLAHSEALLNPKKYGLEKSWSSTYRVRPLDVKVHSSVVKTILVVDDSKSVRATFEKFMKEFNFNVLTAESAAEATVVLKNNHVDLITLDLSMPEKNGDIWLKEQRRAGLKIPVVIVTEAHTSEAQKIFNTLENGAEDYLKKTDIHRNRMVIIERIKSLIESHSLPPGEAEIIKKNNQILSRPGLILIGASTGGTEALGKLLKDFPKNSPPIFIVQHITTAFAKPFAERLSVQSGLPLGKLCDGINIEDGKLYMVDEDYHIGIKKIGTFYKFVRSDTPPVNSHRPSVDFLFNSAQKCAEKCAAILLTGMGSDGAKGLRSLKNDKAMTFCQDEKSCVVYGMPKEAIKLGAAGFIGNIDEIRRQMNHILKL